MYSQFRCFIHRYRANGLGTDILSSNGCPLFLCVCPKDEMMHWDRQCSGGLRREGADNKPSFLPSTFLLFALQRLIWDLLAMFPVPHVTILRPFFAYRDPDRQKGAKEEEERRGRRRISSSFSPRPVYKSPRLTRAGLDVKLEHSYANFRE